MIFNSVDNCENNDQQYFKKFYNNETSLLLYYYLKNKNYENIFYEDCSKFIERLY